MDTKEIKLTSVDREFFNSIFLDNMHIYFGNVKVGRNRKLSVYNQILEYLKIKHKTRVDKLSTWLKEKYKVSVLTDDIKMSFENYLDSNMRPNFYAHMLKVKRKTPTKLSVYAVVGDRVLEHISDSGAGMYTIIKDYCEFWDRANQFCLENSVMNPTELGQKQIQAEFRIAMQEKIVEEVKEIRTLGNDNKSWSLAYYDLNSGNLDAKTPAWDNFLSQMDTDSIRSCFRAWVYALFKGDNFGRQLLWMHGVGGTGKTVVANTLYKRLEQLNPSIVTSLEKMDDMDKFSASTYLDKRFVLGADLTDRKILRNGLVKNLTGNDVISSREMGKAKVAVKAYAKIMITSNVRPFVAVEKPEEVSRLLLISLVPELCKKAKLHWFDTHDEDWQVCLAEELDDFITQSKTAYDEFVLPDNHNLKPYDTFMDVLNEAKYYLKRDMPVWWEHCIEKTDNENDTLKVKVMAVDYQRFIEGEIKLSHYIKRMIQSFCMTFLREAMIPIHETDNFDVVYIRGYRFIHKSEEERVKAIHIIDDELSREVLSEKRYTDDN